MDPLQYLIPGVPIAKHRPRFARRGKHVVTYNDQETDEGRVMWHLQHQHPWGIIPGGVPLQITLVFRLKRPRSHYRTGKYSHLLRDSAPKYPTSRPDLDNYVKFLKDVCNGVVWSDDSQVVRIIAEKVYGDPEGTTLLVSALDRTQGELLDAIGVDQFQLFQGGDKG